MSYGEDMTALQDRLAKEFVAKHPQWPGSTQAAQVMTERVVELVNTGHKLNSETLNEAYKQLLSEDRLFSEQQLNRMSDADLEALLKDSGSPIYKI